MDLNLGNRIDALYALRQMRLEVQRKADDLKAQETAAREEIMELLDSMGMVKGTGLHATCGITTKTEPVVADWEQVHEFIRRENRFDLLQKRLSAPAWRDLREAGVLVPGTDAVPVRDLSLTKSTRG